jgi:predicted membrane-bound dolichyl-phosphate-mannose-protein mannosyltransferase
MRVFLSSTDIFARYDHETSREHFLNSQYSPTPPAQIEAMYDDELYEYAGYTYITTGDITSVNIEHPPLGKYLVGLGILLTGTANFLMVLTGAAVLAVLYLLSYEVFRSWFWAVAPPLLLTWEPMFVDFSTRPFLDIFIVLFSLLIVYVWIKYPLKTKFRAKIMGILIAVLAGIKFPTTAVILVVSLLAAELTKKKTLHIKQKLIVQMLVTAVILYLGWYLPAMLTKGPGEFVRLQIEALRIHLSHVPNYPWFAALQVMFLNQWPVWWDPINPVWQVGQWSSLWIAYGVILVGSPLAFWLRFRVLSRFAVIFVFTWIYFGFINIRLFFPHYLLPVLPVTAIGLTALARETVKLFWRR